MVVGHDTGCHAHNEYGHLPHDRIEHAHDWATTKRTVREHPMFFGKLAGSICSQLQRTLNTLPAAKTLGNTEARKINTMTRLIKLDMVTQPHPGDEL